MKPFLLLVALILAGLSAPAQTAEPIDLTGHVTMPADNSGAATILVLGGQRKLEPPVGGVLRRNPRLPKPTRTDRQGDFRIEGADRASVYHLVVLAPFCPTKRVVQYDPASGPLAVKLEPVDLVGAAPGTVTRGRVLDRKGNPIPGALVRVNGVTRDKMMHWPAEQVDPYAVADDHGNFVVTAQVPFTAVEGSVEAEGFATALFENWEPGDRVHPLTLTEGAAFEGRLVQAGQPVANAEVRLDNFGNESGSSAWNYSTQTDVQGRFKFAHLPGNRSFSIYTTMDSMGARGALRKQRLRVFGDGSTNDAGDLSLDPAFSITGRVRLADQAPLPAQSHLMLSRANMVGQQDSLYAELGRDGAFRFEGVPAEKVVLYLRVPGYELTPQDRLMKGGSSTNLTVSAEVKGMVIDLKPQPQR